MTRRIWIQELDLHMLKGVYNKIWYTIQTLEAKCTDWEFLALTYKITWEKTSHLIKPNDAYMLFKNLGKKGKKWEGELPYAQWIICKPKKPR